MNYFKVTLHALALTAFDRMGDVLSFVIKPTRTAIVGNLPSVKYPWITAPLWTRRSIDGAIIEGVSRKAGAKYAIPKGLPVNGRVLAIENEPHEANGFSGTIEKGYGKGEKTILLDERVPIKLKGKVFFSRINYHIHNADRAGLHYDLVIEDLPPGTKEFELNIPRGEYKGRWAFKTTDKGIIVIPMKDNGLVLPKPKFNLKNEKFLEEVIAPDFDNYILERKYDGSLANANFSDTGRVAFRSHRETEGAQTYYDKLPGIEFVSNSSPFYSLRRIDPAPNLHGTVLKVELLHPDGSARTSGVLNSYPEKAYSTQASRGLVKAVAWNIIKLNGKDVSNLPYVERRKLLEEVIKTIRLYNKNWDIAEKYEGSDPLGFYRKVINDPRGLPYSEGIVIKPKDAIEESWFKVKNRDFSDLVVVDFIEGSGKYANSLGAILVEDPITGDRGKVGSFAIPDAHRDWIWQHRNELAGAVAKVSVMEMTEDNAPRAGVFHGWHPDPRYGGYGTEQALVMYSEALAGMEPEESQRMLYKLKSSAGWSR